MTTEAQMREQFEKALGVPEHYRHKAGGYHCYQKEWRGFKAALASLPRMPDNLPTIVNFGLGKLVVDSGKYDGLNAVFIRPAVAGGKVGECAKHEGGPLDKLVENEVVLVFHNDNASTLVHHLRAALPDFLPRMTEEEIVAWFLPLIEDQAMGEWTDELIRGDAKRFAAALIAKLPHIMKE